MDRKGIETILPSKLKEMFGRAPGNMKYIVKQKDANGLSFIDHYDVFTETTLTTHDENKQPHQEVSELYFGEIRVNYGSEKSTLTFIRDSNKKHYVENLSAQ